MPNVENLAHLGVDTLKELFEHAESRNIVAFIEDKNFCHCSLYNVVFISA